MDFTRFFHEVRNSLFGGVLTQDQVNGINVILDKMSTFSFPILRNQAAYILATAYHETGATMRPVRETFAATDDQAIARLDRAWRQGKLTWVSAPYWRTGWFGRGYVQLTHEANYRKMSDIVGLDLVGNRDLALEKDVAADIIVEGMMTGVSNRGDFTGQALEEHVNLEKSDYRNARRVVNGTESAVPVAGYAKKFEAGLEKAGFDLASEIEGDSHEERKRGADADHIAAIRGKLVELERLLEKLEG